MFCSYRIRKHTYTYIIHFISKPRVSDTWAWHTDALLALCETKGLRQDFPLFQVGKQGLVKVSTPDHISCKFVHLGPPRIPMQIHINISQILKNEKLDNALTYAKTLNLCRLSVVFMHMPSKQQVFCLETKVHKGNAVCNMFSVLCLWVETLNMSAVATFLTYILLMYAWQRVLLLSNSFV